MDISSDSTDTAPHVKSDLLIATDNQTEADYIAKALGDEGYNVKFCNYDGKTLKSIPVKAPAAVICVFSDYIEACPSIIKALKRHFQPKDIPFIGALSRHGDIDLKVFDSVIFPPAHIKQVATRVSSMIRLSQMEREIERRVETLAQDFGIEHALDICPQNIPFRVLFVGKATPDFMVVINALQKKNVEVVAAFTSFSAFDYLHDHSFNAVVMNALEQSEPALTITETMRRNAKLYHVPTLFLVDETRFNDHELAYEKGARDIISARSDTNEISGRILELANYHRIHEHLKSEFDMLGGKACVDLPSGTFNAAFFQSHMKRVIKAAHNKVQPLTLISIKATATGPTGTEPETLIKAYDNIGQMFKSLVRMQDITARLSEDTYLIAFVEQDASSAQKITNRLADIINCAAFDSGRGHKTPLSISLQTSITSLTHDDDYKSFVSRAMDNLRNQPIISDSPQKPLLEAAS